MDNFDFAWLHIWRMLVASERILLFLTLLVLQIFQQNLYTAKNKKYMSLESFLCPPLFVAASNPCGVHAPQRTRIDKQLGIFILCSTFLMFLDQTRGDILLKIEVTSNVELRAKVSSSYITLNSFRIPYNTLIQLYTHYNVYCLEYQYTIIYSSTDIISI